jgi:hypothetical protein
MPPMHATPTLTWCCCDKAWATKEWQMMAHAREQGKAACAAQVKYQWPMHACSIQQCRMVMWHSGVQRWVIRACSTRPCMNGLLLVWDDGFKGA